MFPDSTLSQIIGANDVYVLIEVNWIVLNNGEKIDLPKIKDRPSVFSIVPNADLTIFTSQQYKDFLIKIFNTKGAIESEFPGLVYRFTQ